MQRLIPLAVLAAIVLGFAAHAPAAKADSALDQLKTIHAPIPHGGDPDTRVYDGSK